MQCTYRAGRVLKDSEFSARILEMQLIKNSAYLFATRFINSLAILGLVLVISRRLGPDIFGGYSFLNAVIMTGIVTANFGLDTLMVREVSRDHLLGNQFLSSVLGFKIISSLVVMAGVYTLFRFFLHDQAMIRLLALFSIVLCLNSLAQSRRVKYHYSPAPRANRMALPKSLPTMSMTIPARASRRVRLSFSSSS